MDVRAVRPARARQPSDLNTFQSSRRRFGRGSAVANGWGRPCHLDSRYAALAAVGGPWAWAVLIAVSPQRRFLLDRGLARGVVDDGPGGRSLSYEEE
jgi:hypothetical protein